MSEWMNYMHQDDPYHSTDDLGHDWISHITIAVLQLKVSELFYYPWLQ